MIQLMDEGVIYAVKLGYRRAVVDVVLVVEEMVEDTLGQRTLQALKLVTLRVPFTILQTLGKP